MIARIRPATNERCARGIGERDSWVSSPAASPSVTRAMAAYDAESHRAIVLGGGTSDTTWEWDGKTWTPVAGSTPHVRGGRVLATAPGGGVILFGGVDSSGAPMSESWRYASGHWTTLHGTRPAARASAAMAFDLDHHRTLMRGGAPCTDRRMWSWSDTTWAVVDSAGPAPRIGASMAYDPTTRSVVLTGGRECDGSAPAESWRWDGKRWSALTGLPASDHVCLVYSPMRNRMLLFTIDSTTAASAWQLSGAHWQRVALSPPALADGACVFDAANQRLVLVGRSAAQRQAATYLLVQ